MFSIIIPVKEINEYVRTNLKHIAKLSGHCFELIIVPNEYSHEQKKLMRSYPFLRFLNSGRISPGEKRDLAALNSSAEFLAFLDDDAFPSPDYLINLKNSFDKSPEVIGICGPGVTPKDSSLKELASGAVYLSKLSGGFPERYRPYGPAKFVDDWPSVNLVVKREAFCSVGGFNTKYWPGEDTFLCYKLKQSGFLLKYDPLVVVLHHRRSGFAQHISQAFNYGVHRGFFFKKYPETSRRLVYLIPSSLVILSIIGLTFLEVFSSPWHLAIYSFFSLYLMSVILACADILFQTRMVLVSALALPYIIGTHYSYGIGFMQGIWKSRLTSRLR